MKHEQEYFKQKMHRERAERQQFGDFYNDPKGKQGNFEEFYK